MLRARRPLSARASSVLRSGAVQSGFRLQPAALQRPRAAVVQRAPVRHLSDGGKGLSAADFILRYPLPKVPEEPPAFLKPLVDFGVNYINAIHSVTGLPWWATIITSAVVMRVAFLPLTVYQYRKGALQARLQPHFQYLQGQLNALKIAPHERLAQFATKKRQLLKQHSYGAVRRWIPLVAQLTGVISLALANRRLIIEHQFGEALTGGTLWFPNLAEFDPYFVLPVMAAGFGYFTISNALGVLPRSQPSTDHLSWTRRFLLMMQGPNLLRTLGSGMQVLLLCGLPIMLGSPAGFMLFGATIAVWQFTQGILVRRSPAVRRLMGFDRPPLPMSQADLKLLTNAGAPVPVLAAGGAPLSPAAAAAAAKSAGAATAAAGTAAAAPAKPAAPPGPSSSGKSSGRWRREYSTLRRTRAVR